RRKTSGHRDDYFSNLFVAFQIAVRLDDLVERKRLRNYRRQQTLTQTFFDEYLCSLESFRVVYNFKNKISAHGEPLHRRRAKRKNRVLYLPAEITVKDQPPSRRHRCCERRANRTADWFERHS